MEDNRIQTSLFTTLADIKEEVIVSIAGEKASHPSQDTKFSFVKEEVIVSTTSQSSQDTKALPIPPGIHTIEGYVISSIKTHHKFTSADFDAFKEITEPLPIPKFKILGQAELASLRSKPVHGKESKRHGNGLGMNGDINKDWLKLERPKGGLIHQFASLSTCYSFIFCKYVGKFIAMDPARQGGAGSAYLTVCKDVQGHASLRCIIKVDAVFEHCWSPADGRKALDGPDLIFTFASLKPNMKTEWDHLHIYCSILDKRSHFAIENFLFTGPSSDRMKYGPTFLEAICIFLSDLYDCPDYPPPTQIRWDLQSVESAECHFEQAAAVRREVANNSEVLQFLSNTFADVGNGSYIKHLQ